MLRVLALSVAGVVATVSMASSQARVELTPFVGYYIASDLYNSYAVAGAGVSNVELLNSVAWGGKLTFSSPRSGLELSYTRTGSDVRLHNVQAGQPNNDVGRVNIDNYDINFIGYQMTGNPRVAGFGEIGLGWAVTHPEINATFLGQNISNPNGNTLFNFNFGLGVRMEMNPKLAMRLEGRWRVMDTNITTSSGIWCDPYGYCYGYASDWYNSGELIAGLSYTLR
jgi:hypothetical protein